MRASFPTAEEVSLKQGEAVLGCGQHLHARFDFLRNHAASLPVRGGEGLVLFGLVPPDVNFEEVRVLDEGLSWIVRNKIVERDAVALVFEALACGADNVVGRDTLLNLDDDLVGRQQEKVILQQHLMGGIHECKPPIADSVEADDIQGRDGAGSSAVEIRVEATVVSGLAEQQLVTDDLIVLFEDGLAGEPGIGFVGGSVSGSAHSPGNSSAGPRESFRER